MKKLNLFFAMFLMATAGLMTSCTQDDAVAPTVSVEVVGTPTYLPGETVQYKVILGTSNKELTTFTVSGAGSIQPASGSQVNYTEPADQWDSATAKFVDDVTSVTVYYDVVIDAGLQSGQEFELNFEVGDDSQNKGSETATIVVASSGTLKTNNITLGAQSNNVGGAAASFEGSVFTLSQSASNASIIDILYYNGSKGAAIYAPTQSDIQGISGWNWSSWSVKNATRFVMASSSDFSDATSSSVETLASSASLDVAQNLSVGSVVAFTTINNKSGIFKVTSLDDSSTGTISIEVKIQDSASSK